MRKLFTVVVNNPKKTVVAFGIILVVCLVMWQFVGVDYNIYDYLSTDSKSSVALKVLEEEYDGGIPNMNVMVEDISVAEALTLKDTLELVPGVEQVTWLDDMVDIAQPLDFIDASIRDAYYCDESALFTLTVNDLMLVSATEEIKDIVGEKGHIAGAGAATAAATVGTQEEIPVIAVVGMLFAVVMLMLTMTTLVEPMIIMIGLGVAIGMNAGTNLIFGDISFITNAAGSVLQLAVSLDYSVFILHRFEEYRKKTDNVKDAMLEALCSSVTSVLSSGITTVIGFIALCFMKFKIGPDLGMALAKGVALSLITAFLFLPALVLVCYRLIDKTRHRPLMPSFAKVGEFALKITVPALIIFAMLIIPCFLASNANDFYFGASHIYAEGTELGDDTALIEETFDMNDTYVLMVDKSSTAKQQELSDELKSVPEVLNIVSYVDTVGATIPTTYLDAGTLSQLNSENYTRMIITVDAEAEGEDTFTLVEEIRGIAEKYYPGTWLLAGEGVSTLDLKDSVTSDLLKVNLIAALSILIVLFFAMQSLILPFVLVLGIETAIWVNMAIPYFGGSNVFYIAYLMISSIQLGATVDYAILYTDRYKEFRQRMSRRDAVIATTKNTFVSIITSGSVLTVMGFLMGIFATHGMIAQMGIMLGRGTICSLIIVFLVLPSLLYVLDGPIQRFSKNCKFLNEKTGIAAGGEIVEMTLEHIYGDASIEENQDQWNSHDKA